jgi:hypothetical protein
LENKALKRLYLRFPPETLENKGLKKLINVIALIYQVMVISIFHKV